MKTKIITILASILAFTFGGLIIQRLTSIFDLAPNLDADTAYAETHGDLPRAVFEYYGIAELGDADGIKFLWVRSFHPTVLIELCSDDLEATTYSAKEFQKIWGISVWKTIFHETYNGEESRNILNYFLADVAILSGPRIEQIPGKLDGSTWYFEVKRADQHAYFLFDSPKAGSAPFQLGSEMIEQATELLPIY